MNLKVKIGQATLTITDRSYLGAGGEAAVYANGNEVVKLYHDRKKMIPLSKIQELSVLRPANVIKPLAVVYDAGTGEPLGYTMRYLKQTEPLCKFFTKAFKQDRNIDADMMMALVKAMQLTVQGVHDDKCLIVDLNEMNVLVDDTNVNPLFIDTDSYETPSHHATAIMESIRDPQVKGHRWTPESDWFSFGVLAFQLYINIHPFKGRHPAYDPKDWRKRMDDGVSVFDPKIKLPPVCNPLTVVPKRHLEWFKAVFQKGERSAPPLPDASAPLAQPAQIVTVQGSNQFEVSECWSTTGNIKAIYTYMGVIYAATTDAIYLGPPATSRPNTLSINLKRPAKLQPCAASDGALVIARQEGTLVTFQDHAGVEIGRANSNGCFCRNHAIYTAWNGRLQENTFVRTGSLLVHRSKDVENICALSAHVYEGVVIQDLLGKMYVTVPYAAGRCSNRPVPALNGMRIVDAKGERNVVVVVAEKQGTYHRFILVYKPDFSEFKVIHQPDIAYDGINMTVLESGVYIIVSGDKMLVNGTTEFDNPPLDANMKLFNVGGSAYFVNGNSIHRIKTR